MAKKFSSFEELYVKEFGGHPKQTPKKKPKDKKASRFEAPWYDSCEYREGEALPWVFKFTTVGTQARTISPSALVGEHNGWAVFGEVHVDCYAWVNDFCARKGDYEVKGNFESEVRASSKKAYYDFVHSVKVREWDYWDI